jgi:phospholipid/cholesterol/gamma-HCH transport system substrate-binding protein
MENRAHALIAGLFAISLGLAVLVAIWWLSGNREATRSLLLVTQRSVSGLNPQAQVRFRGVRCGKVQEIYLDPADPTTIVVRVNIRRDIPITAATTAELKPQGITGLSYIELHDAGLSKERLPLSPPAEPPRIALKPSTVDLLGEDIGATLASVRALFARITLAVNDQNLEKLAKTLGHVESASGNLAASAAQMPQMIQELRGVISPENVQRIEKLIRHLEATGRETAPLVADLRALVKTTQGAVASFDAATTETVATVNQDTLPRINLLLDEVGQATRQAARVAQTLDAEPQSLIFGPAPARPGPGEPGFVMPVSR